MPAILIGTSQCNEQMWQALKIHIMRERQRKKQEKEADIEIERLRKERERQQKQDVTFDETRDQIINLEDELVKLITERHDLRTELKRVEEDEYEGDRKRQFIKEDSICPEVLTVGYSPVNTKATYPQILLPTAQGTSSMYESNVAEPQMLTTGPSNRTFSPPSTPPISHHTSYYKSLPYISNYNPSSPFKSNEPVVRLPSHSRELTKNMSLFRWLFENSISSDKRNYDYSSIMPQPSRETPELSKPTYPIHYYSGSRTPLTTHQPAYVTNIHSMEQHKDAYDEKRHYLRSNQSTVHDIPIQPQNVKTDEITTGFPVRTSAVFPRQPPPHTPAVTYADMSHITLSRILYNQPYKMRTTYNKTGL